MKTSTILILVGFILNCSVVWIETRPIPLHFWLNSSASHLQAWSYRVFIPASILVVGSLLTLLGGLLQRR